MSNDGKFNLFGGLFDFNNDGKTDIGEEFIAYEICNDITKDDDDFLADLDLDLDDLESK